MNNDLYRYCHHDAHRRWIALGVIAFYLVILSGGLAPVWAQVPTPPASVGTDADPMSAAETLGGSATETVSQWIAVGVIIAAAIALGVTLGRAIGGRGSWGEPVIALFVGAIVVIGSLYWLDMASGVFGGGGG